MSSRLSDSSFPHRSWHHLLSRLPSRRHHGPAVALFTTTSPGSAWPVRLGTAATTTMPSPLTKRRVTSSSLSAPRTPHALLLLLAHQSPQPAFPPDGLGPADRSTARIPSRATWCRERLPRGFSRHRWSHGPQVLLLAHFARCLVPRRLPPLGLRADAQQPGAAALPGSIPAAADHRFPRVLRYAVLPRGSPRQSRGSWTGFASSE